MIPARSLRGRLLLGAGLWIGAALLVTWLVLGALFRAHEVAQHEAELGQVLDQLTAALLIEADGPRLTREPADPRFERAYGGRYWQVAAGGVTLRSRSLWDQELPATSNRPLGVALVEVPALGQLRQLSRSVAFAGATDSPIEIAVAMPEAEIDAVARRFNGLIGVALTLLGSVLLLAALVQVELGLRPLARLRRDVARIRTGEVAALPAAQPAELRPLVEELNLLLTENQAMVERSRRRAADLAHGLQTSLQVVAIEAAKLGNEATATITAEVARMRDVVARELARARAGGARSGRAELTDVAAIADQVARAIRVLAADRAVSVTTRVDPSHRFRGDAADLAEILGNLLENAAKWANRAVRLESLVEEGRLVLLVEDDGAGLAPERREEAFERGVRLDERRPGSGLGLAITRDLVAAYGGTVTLGTAALGGLQVRVELPVATSPLAARQ
jgi:signal transduction histidine kinase